MVNGTTETNGLILDPSQTLYQAYKVANTDNLRAPALYDLEKDRCFSHGDIIQKADKAADGFWNLGVRKNTCVGIMTNNSIYEPICFLALNKIGAVTKFLDYSKSIRDIQNSINISEVKYLVIEAEFLAIESEINTGHIPVVVLDLPCTNDNPAYITFEKLILSTNCTCLESDFHKDKPSVIINSSGTTGTPKPIVHSDYSLNIAANNVLHTDFPLTKSNVMLKVVPSHIGLGLITTLYTCLLSGTPIVLIKFRLPPEQSINKSAQFIFNFPQWILKKELNRDAKLLLFFAPIFVRGMFNLISVCSDLSHIGVMLAAGSKMSKEELDKIELAFREKGCRVPICNGYGQNEMCGAVTLDRNGRNKNGSAGIPVIGTKLNIVDHDTLEPLSTGQIGKVLERSESAFLYYDHSVEQTNKAFVTLPDGSKWFDSNDLGYLDDEGFLYITGRTSRVLIRFDHKISIDGIEQKIKSNPIVTDCAIIPIIDDHINGSSIAFISLQNDSKKYTSDQIAEIIQSGEFPLSDFETPTRYVCLEFIPYMANGKVDYEKLTEMSKTIDI